MEKVARERHQWTLPEDKTPKLKVNNSLTRSKDEFRPAEGKTVKWYSCGPTVYDHSHMGHARSYVSFDIIRRILRDYFGYDVFYQINITDIDDKIIKRARQQHLFQNWKKSNPSKDEVIEHANNGIDRYQKKLDEETDPDKKTMYNNHLAGARSSVENFESIEKVLETCVDSISDYLDKKLGSSVTDNSIFDALPRYWEKSYFEDMQALNIEDPDCLTRVSEYVPEIVTFVEKIIEQGYAYESNGSVYFKVDHFDSCCNHYYAKLVPEAVGNREALAEGEGSLAAAASEKRSESDFALWKNSKPGEPSWDSPWGKGRPGWHIECSVMASDIMGKTMDIHSGGVDLKFPHHDNELAQSEACHGNDNWVQYFLHTGHLTIAGCKMSKSLKNFITIKEALKKNSARQIRLSFLLHAWDKTLDYSDNTLADAVQYEKAISEFFANIKAALLNDDGILKKWGTSEKELHAEFMAAQNDVHEKLCDNLNTAGACHALKDIVSATNKYLAKQENPDFKLLRNVGTYVTKIMKCFGCLNSDEQIGFPAEGQAQNQNMDQLVAPYLQCLAQFRQEIRNTTRGDNSDLSKKLMQMCDDLRDMKLVDLGVRLEDKMDETGKPIIKLGNREQLLADRAAKEEEKRKKDEQKRAQAEKKAREEAEKDKIAAIPPTEWFKKEEHLKLYTQWNDAGLPTHKKHPESGEEEEIPKSALKKLTKELNAQKSKHDKWLKKQQA